MINSFKIITTLSLVLCCFCLSAQWTQVASFPGAPRHHPITFSLNGFGYVMAGSSDTEDLQDLYKYDPIADSWTQLPDFPGGQRGFSYGVTSGDKAYVGFGATRINETTIRYFDLWEFDADSEAWTQLADCPCSGRRHPALVATSTHIYVGLGGDSQGNQNDWWAYEIATDTWEQKADFPSRERHHPYYFAIDDIPYVGFGHGAAIYNDFYSYDPSSDEWSYVNFIPSQGRVAGTQFSYGGKGYALSGDGDTHENLPTGEFWEFDPSNKSWTRLEPHPGIGRWAPGNFLIENQVFFLGGETDFLHNDMWTYTLEFVSNTTEAQTEGLELAMSPNPSSGMIFLETQESELTVEVFGLDGKLLYTKKAVRTQLDLSSLPSGSYSIRFTDSTSNKQVTKQVIIK